MGGNGALVGAYLQVARDLTAREVVLKGEVAALKKDMGRLLKLLVGTQVPPRHQPRRLRSPARIPLCRTTTPVQWFNQHATHCPST